MSSLRFEWVEDTEGFARLREPWDALAASAVETIFLTYDWLATWLVELAPDSELHVLTAWDGGRLVGALPLCGSPGIDRGRLWYFMGEGTLTPNHLDIVAEPTVRDEVRVHVVELLLERSAEWDVLEFGKLPAETGTPAALEAGFAAAGIATSCSDAAVCYVCSLPDTYEEYLAERSKNTRKKIGEVRRWLRRQPETFQLAQTQTEEQALAALEALERFHQARWEARGYPGAFAEPRVVSFHMAVVRNAQRNGQLRMYTLADGDEIIAVSYNYCVGQVAEAYLASFDARYFQGSPGVLLRAYAVEQLIAEGVGVFDWLEGAESYKTAWSTGQRRDVSLRAYGRSWAGRIARLWHAANVEAVRLARVLVPGRVRESLNKMAARARGSRQTSGPES